MEGLNLLGTWRIAEEAGPAGQILSRLKAVSTATDLAGPFGLHLSDGRSMLRHYKGGLATPSCGGEAPLGVPATRSPLAAIRGGYGAGRISQIARLYWSPVGAVSEIETVVLLSGVVAFRRWTQ